MMSDLYYFQFMNDDGVQVKESGVWDDPVAAASHMLTIQSGRTYELRRVRDEALIFVAPEPNYSVDGFNCRDIVWVNVLDWSVE
jgi:hypothetical protein